MSLVINTNIASLNAQQNLTNSGLSLQTSLARLSSGLRINSAKDDAAGLAISDRFTTQINGLNQAIQNANDGISLAQTADGALQEVTNNLQRIRQLAVQAANATNSDSDRASLDAEVQQRIQEITRIATQTSFNNRNVLDGTFGNAAFQVGANVGQTISVGLNTSAKASDIGTFVNQTSNVGQTIAAANVTTTQGATDTLTAPTTSYTGVDQTALSATDLTINGVKIGASAAGTGAGQSAFSAWAKAQAINQAGVPGVTATASTSLSFNAVSGSNFFSTSAPGATGDVSYALSINGQQVISADFSGASAGSISLGSAVQSINSQSSTTGVTASVGNNGQLVLTAADGRDITVAETYGGSAAPANAVTAQSVFSKDVGTAGQKLASSTSDLYSGQVTLASNSAVAVGGTNGPARLGLTSGTLPATSLAAQNVLTVSGANSTIQSVDSALTSIDTLRGTFGAIQNRFQSTIANLGTSTQNLSAARSRVQDADFAAETSNLTRAQILQQAGTSILAQANALPQGVLKLLQ